ncbi:hypothetical protein ANCDUO_10350 [Ancylostoma duodenale]|uniref:ISXO2-like transposase domain-containing protein n=1 Tax=Ancylostoma duodenale TaxID=51022 RepID=A0A0C2GKN6_9BILA|nr:hypothetical protein ANCDUO_10350 [Ancylostoma duodenale]
MKADRSRTYTHTLSDFDGKMASGANLLTLRDFTLNSTWPELAAKTKEEFDEWLADGGVLWKERPCPNCGNPRKVTKPASGTGDDVRLKFECYKRQCRQPGIPYKVGYLKETFFETLRGDCKRIFLTSYLFAYDLGLVKEMARTLEVDETHIVRRKYNVGGIVRRDWLIGGIQDGTKLVFVKITDDRSAANLDAIIQKHVIPGGVIRTDMWRGYSNLTNLGYIHETVNYSVNFLDPVTGVHT